MGKPRRAPATPASAPGRCRLYRHRFEHYGRGRPEQAIVGLGGHVFIQPNSQDAIREIRPYFANTSFGRGSTVEDYMQQTPLTVGSPQQVLERYTGMRELFGDYQRQLFLLNLPGMSLSLAREQLDELTEVVPLLRKELDHGWPAHVSAAPTHASLTAARHADMPAPPAQNATQSIVTATGL